MKRENVWATVAVRLKSSRLSQKALLPLAGEPLIARLTQRLAKSRMLEGVCWCTSDLPDDDPLEELSLANRQLIYRGDPLDVMGRFLAVAKLKDAGTIVRVTGDNPLTDPDMLDAMITEHLSHDAEYTYTEDPPRGTRAEIIDVQALTRIYAQLEDPASSEYMTYMLKRPDKMKMHRYQTHNAALTRPELRLTVDTQQDYDLMCAIYEAFAGEPPKLIDIIGYLDEHPALRDSNQQTETNVTDAQFNVRFIGDGHA